MMRAFTTIICWLIPIYPGRYSTATATATAAADGTFPNPCTPGTRTPFNIELETDYGPEETTWGITDFFTEILYESNGPYTNYWTVHNETYCLAADGCFEFRIEDNYGEFAGYYKLFWDGELIKVGGDFGRREVVMFGTTCPTSSPVTSSPTTSPTISPTKNMVATGTTMTANDTKSKNVGLIVGASVGCFGGILILTTLIYLFRKGKKRKEFDSESNRPPKQISIA